MSEKDKHSQKWGVPLEEVAGKVSGTLVDYPDFQAAELHANIKRGMEVPLSGVASMPDVIRKALALREAQNTRALKWVEEVEKIVNDGEDLSEDEKQSAVETAKREVHRQLLSPKARVRYEFAETVLESITRHLMTETAAVEGGARKDAGDMVKALVLHEKDFDSMFPSKQKRSWRHPLGDKER